jgi:hypothetical protein
MKPDAPPKPAPMPAPSGPSGDPTSAPTVAPAAAPFVASVRSVCDLDEQRMVDAQDRPLKSLWATGNTDARSRTGG